MITSKQPSAVGVLDTKKRRKTILVILIIVILVLVLDTGIVFVTMLAAVYGTTDDLYKQTICAGKALEFAQKGIIRDVGGFNGALYECMHMNYRNSIYGDVLSAVAQRGVLA